jgi:hypothetical protein
MEHSNKKTRRGRLAVAALAGGALIIAMVGGTTASAGGEAGTAAGPATITMQFQKGKFYFSGAKRVRSGSKLRIRNNTSPMEGGPHTFSLVVKSVLPTAEEQKTCFPGGICGTVGTAHEFTDDEKVGKPLVKAGKSGWDRSFTTKRKGDTWYSETKGETVSQKVSARKGATLRFMCVIHPEMQGKIKVIGRK